MFKLPYSCNHFTCQQGNGQNPTSQASTAHEPRIFRCTSWIQKRKRNQRSSCQHLLEYRESKKIPEIYLLLLLLNCFSCFRLCVTLQMAAHQAPPSLGFSRQENWSGLSFPSLPNMQNGSSSKLTSSRLLHNESHPMFGGK